MNTWELIAVVAYCLTFALVESIIILSVLVLAGVILPAPVFRDRWVAKGSTAVFVTSIWAIAAHYNDEIVRLWGAREFLIWLSIYLASLFLALLLVGRFKAVGQVLRSLVERLAVLSAAYVFADVLGILVVITRNIAGSS